jgi:hypothetical protein
LQVEDDLLIVFPGVRKRGDLVSAVAQLTVVLDPDHRPLAIGPDNTRQVLLPDADGQLEAVCFTTIPKFHGFEPDSHGGPLAPSQVHYADKRSATITREYTPFSVHTKTLRTKCITYSVRAGVWVPLSSLNLYRSNSGY